MRIAKIENDHWITGTGSPVIGAKESPTIPLDAIGPYQDAKEAYDAYRRLCSFYNEFQQGDGLQRQDPVSVD